jgi:hypothetical protein
MKDPIGKITKPKGAGGMTQVMEHLPRKCKALSSNPSTNQKIKYWSSVLKNAAKLQILFGSALHYASSCPACLSTLDTQH